jgi:hypothetical protein
MSIKEKLLVERIAAEADETRDEPMPTGAVGNHPNKSVPVTVRLTLEDVAAIETLADQLDVTMSALLRGWIVTALKAKHEESLTTAIDRIAADVQRLRELAV